MDAITTPPTPLDRLRLCAGLWTEAHEAKPARLSRLVINDGGFFARLDSPDADTTTGTVTKFARFLADPANWPGEVPEEASAFAHVMGVSAPLAAPSPGKADEVSPNEERNQRDAA